MTGFAKAKRVTDPLDDKAKARLFTGQHSYVSSGSEHFSDYDSPCLSELVQGFLEEDNDSDVVSLSHDSNSEQVNSVTDYYTEAFNVITKSNAVNRKDRYRNVLVGHVLKATEIFSSMQDIQKPVLRRKVMTYLRELGHNAAICKTKWESSGNLTAGNYEFIDVLVQLPSSTCQYVRYFVDLDFASQFEIARPTTQYSSLFKDLPRVFVGQGEDLKKIVKVMCDAVKRSLRSRELALPPWRKTSYVQSKWFNAPYRRTVNPVSSNSLTAATPYCNGVKCRFVGFDDPVNGRMFVRTR